LSLLISITIAVVALLFGGFSKGLIGMGLPMVAIPILTLLFDLQSAIAITLVPSMLTNIVVLARLPKSWSVIQKAAPLMIFGMLGILLGSYFLVHINQYILMAVLGAVILIFVITSFFSLLPTLKRKLWLDGVFGLIGGTLQGASGASGPIVSMYMLQMKISRNEFLFLMNSFFMAINIVQLITIYQLGLYKGVVAYYALGGLVPVLLALAVAMEVQKRISDTFFRNFVLVVTGISGLVLLYKSYGFFF
jgi:uncharacterized membrane protein YfcA